MSHTVSADKLSAELKSRILKVGMHDPSKLTNSCYHSNLGYGSTSSLSWANRQHISSLTAVGGKQELCTRMNKLKTNLGSILFSYCRDSGCINFSRVSLMSESDNFSYEFRLLSLIIFVNLNGLYSTVTTLCEGHQYYLIPTVFGIWDSLANEDISSMQCISANRNVVWTLDKYETTLIMLQAFGTNTRL